MYSKARTDADFTPLPNPLPTFPSVGQTFRDPSFNPTYPSTYVRVTDPSIGPANAFIMATGGSAFNLDDTLLWCTNDGAAIFMFGLVPETMQTGLVSIIPGSLSFGNGYFSQVDPNWFYTLNPLTGQLWCLDFSGINIANPNNNPPATLIFDFTTVGLTGNATFAGIGGNDRIFAAYFGTQDDPSAVNVAAYNSRTGKCSIYNTHAGTVDGAPASTADSYFIHGAHLPDPKGNWMWVTRSTLNPNGAPLYAWAVGSPLLLPIGGFNDGHGTANSHGFFNNASGVGGYPSLIFRRWVDFNTAKVISLNKGSAAYNPTMDTHPTAVNDRSGDGGLPIFATTNAPHTMAAYENEIIAWPSEPGLIRRFGRTFNSGLPTELFQGQNSIGAVSPSGKFFAFTTDCQATLGPNRTDVFILALPD